MTMLSKGGKPDNFESHNSRKISFPNTRSLWSNSVDGESFLGSNSPDILALCEANLDDSIDFRNFYVRDMHSLAVYVKERLPFAWGLSLENSLDFYLRFRLALLHLVSYFFSLSLSLSLLLCTVFDSVAPILDKVLSIKPSAIVFFFGEFNVHQKDWLTYSGGTGRPAELCYNLSISNDLTRWLTFLFESLTVTLKVLLFWIYLFLSMLVFVLQWLSLGRYR